MELWVLVGPEGQRLGASFGLVGAVNTRRWAVQRPRDEYTLGATSEPRRALRWRLWLWGFSGCNHGLHASNSLHGVLGPK